MAVIATPELLTALFEEYKVRGQIITAYEAYVEANYGPDVDGPIRSRENRLALERESVVNDILCLNCNSGETMQMREKFVIDNDLVTQCAELAGMWIEQDAKTGKVVRS